MLLLSLLLVNFGTAPAQNLVPNPSFEDYYDCPINFGQWAEVVDWTSPYNHSADYFNECAGTGNGGVPLNAMGEQYPADGAGYMGLYTYALGDPSYREFISAELSEPLQPGVPVYLCFKIAIGGFGSTAANSANFTCSGVGMKFFNALPQGWNAWYDYLQPEYPNSAAIHLEEAITDTSSWVTVSGMYVPDSAYTQLVIGNFFDDSLSNPEIFDTWGYGVSNAAYVFIDQVAVTYDPDYCSRWSSIQVIPELSTTVGPNPFFNTLLVSLNSKQSGSHLIRLLDATGRTVMQEDWPEGKTEELFNFSGLTSGYYTLLVINAQGMIHSYALVLVSP